MERVEMKKAESNKHKKKKRAYTRTLAPVLLAAIVGGLLVSCEFLLSPKHLRENPNDSKAQIANVKAAQRAEQKIELHFMWRDLPHSADTENRVEKVRVVYAVGSPPPAKATTYVSKKSKSKDFSKEENVSSYVWKIDDFSAGDVVWFAVYPKTDSGWAAPLYEKIKVKESLATSVSKSYSESEVEEIITFDRGTEEITNWPEPPYTVENPGGDRDDRFVVLSFDLPDNTWCENASLQFSSSITDAALEGPKGKVVPLVNTSYRHGDAEEAWEALDQNSGDEFTFSAGSQSISVTNAVNQAMLYKTDALAITVPKDGVTDISVTFENLSIDYYLGEESESVSTSTVTYKKNDGSGKTVDEEVVDGDSVILESDRFTRDGYVIDSWNTIDDGSGDSYEAGTSFTVNSDVTLYAQWGHSITFNKNASDASGDMEKQRIGVGETETLFPCAYTRSGYDFIGWEDSSGNYFDDGESFLMGGSDMTLNAHWIPNNNWKPMLAHYTFTGNADDTLDNYPGTVSGAALSQDRYGKYSRAYQFDGSSSYIEVPSLDTETVFKGDYTISLWVLLDQEFSQDRPIISKKFNISLDHSSEAELQLEVRNTNPDKFRFFMGENDGANWPQINSTTEPQAGVWYHVVVQVGSNELRMYINGVSEGNTTISTRPTPENPLIIGKAQDWGASSKVFFDGKIDNIRIYDSALSETEIQTIYDSEKP